MSHRELAEVTDGRDRAALDGYFAAVGEAGCAQIEMVAMDMWPAYIGSVHDHTAAPIALHKFHIAQHLGAAVDQVIKRHWDGVINAVLTNVTNARAEGINAKIQWIKRQGCGYRNRERFRNAIYVHLGGLDLYPDALRRPHKFLKRLSEKPRICQDDMHLRRSVEE